MIDVHSAAGRRFEAGGGAQLRPRAGRAGRSSCSSTACRRARSSTARLIPALADQGVQAVAFDFPGLGLADRPAELRLLVVGPRELVRRGDRRARPSIASTSSSTTSAVRSHASGRSTTRRGRSRSRPSTRVLDPDGFTRPWPMRPFAVRGLGELWLATRRRRRCSRRSSAISGSRTGPRSRGRSSTRTTPCSRRGDGGRAFLRDHARVRAHRREAALLRGGARRAAVPDAGRLGRDATRRSASSSMAAAQRILGAPDAHPVLPAKHFLQEDQAPRDRRGRSAISSRRSASRARRPPRARRGRHAAGGRRPRRGAASPRSGSGMSTRSKSRGASAPGKTSRASARMSGTK